MDYPVVFTLRDVVSGNGFLAGVSVSGRALIVQEDGAWWTLGVRPAALAEKGESLMESFKNFREGFKAYLIDTASSASSFDVFKAEVERFFYERDETDEQRWNDARQAILQGTVG